MWLLRNALRKCSEYGYSLWKYIYYDLRTIYFEHLIELIRHNPIVTFHNVVSFSLLVTTQKPINGKNKLKCCQFSWVVKKFAWFELLLLLSLPLSLSHTRSFLQSEPHPSTQNTHPPLTHTHAHTIMFGSCHFSRNLWCCFCCWWQEGVINYILDNWLFLTLVSSTSTQA